MGRPTWIRVQIREEIKNMEGVNVATCWKNYQKYSTEPLSEAVAIVPFYQAETWMKFHFYSAAKLVS